MRLSRPTIVLAAAIGSFLLACTSDSGPTATESTQEASGESNGTPEMLPEEEQPGWHDFPYAACPVIENREEACGKENLGFSITSKDENGLLIGSVCLPKCSEDLECEPLGDAEMNCFSGWGCYAGCTKDSDCSTGRICINLPGTGMCGWPILYK